MRGLGKKLPFSPERPRFGAHNSDLTSVRAPGGRNTVESRHPPPKRAVRLGSGLECERQGRAGFAASASAIGYHKKQALYHGFDALYEMRV